MRFRLQLPLLGLLPLLLLRCLWLSLQTWSMLKHACMLLLPRELHTVLLLLLCLLLIPSWGTKSSSVALRSYTRHRSR